MTVPDDWRIEGTYFEACNCEAVCPCRQRGDRLGGRSTFGTCDFALSWFIDRGRADDIGLADLELVMAGRYDDEPGSPWRVALYIDESADSDQQFALADIFLGRAGGTTVANFAKSIDEVYAIRSAKIRLDHTAERQRIDVDGRVTVRAIEPVQVTDPSPVESPVTIIQGPSFDVRK